MAWKEDILFDTRLQPVETRELVVRIANQTLRFWVRVLFIPAVLLFQFITYRGTDYIEIVLFPLSILQLYLLFVDPRITRFQLVMQRGLDTVPLIQAASRFLFIRQVQSDERLMDALDDTTTDAQAPDSGWTAILYLFAAPAVMWALTSHGVEVDHTEFFTLHAVLVFLPVVVGAALAMWTYCVRLGASVEANGDGIVKGKGKVSIPFEELTHVRLEWDVMFTREYLRLSHPTGEYRLYNDTDDPLFLLRLLKYRLQVDIHEVRAA